MAQGGLLRLRRGDRRHRRRRAGVRPRGVAGARECGGGRRRRAPRPPGRLRRRAVRPRDHDERALRGEVSARVRALAPCHRPRGRGDRARPRGGGGRARVHGEGKRPAPLRARVQGPLSGREGDRAPARPRLDARRGDRVRARQGHSRHPDVRVSLLDRREPLRALDRGGHPRRPVERAAGGALRIHLRPCQALPRRSRSSSASSREFPLRSTARSCRSRSSSAG